MLRILRVSLVLLAFVAPFAFSEGPAYEPRISKASGDWKLALAGISVPKGFSIDLWAAEPLLANPVAFTIDHKGRCFVAETFRLHQGVTDIRSHRATARPTTGSTTTSPAAPSRTASP